LANLSIFAIFSSSPIVLLQSKNLKSIKYTGTPENIKEIESLVSSWDYKEVVCKRLCPDGIPSFSTLLYSFPVS
jgi:hypothetical protein